MRRLLLLLLPLAGLVLPLTSAATTLRLDPLLSRVQSGPGSFQTLSGSVEIDVGPTGAFGPRTFDVVGLDLVGSGGLRIGLDPAAPAPGLGVASLATGGGGGLIPFSEVLFAWDVLIGTLFLEVSTGGAPFPLAIPDVPGDALFGSDGLSSLRTGFRLDAGPQGLLDVKISAVAVPEPATAALVVLVAPVLVGALRRKETR